MNSVFSLLGTFIADWDPDLFPGLGIIPAVIIRYGNARPFDEFSPRIKSAELKWPIENLHGDKVGAQSKWHLSDKGRKAPPKFLGAVIDKGHPQRLPADEQGLQCFNSIPQRLSRITLEFEGFALCELFVKHDLCMAARGIIGGLRQDRGIGRIRTIFIDELLENP